MVYIAHLNPGELIMSITLTAVPDPLGAELDLNARFIPQACKARLCHYGVDDRQQRRGDNDEFVNQALETQPMTRPRAARMMSSVTDA